LLLPPSLRALTSGQRPPPGHEPPAG
jgi:hypothetical protein